MTKRWHFVAVAQILDVLVVLTMATLTYSLLDKTDTEVRPGHYIWISTVIGILCHFGFARGHLYEIEYIRNAARSTRLLLVHWTRVFLLLATLAVLTQRGEGFFRLWFFWLYIGGATAFTLERVVLARLYGYGLRLGLYRRNVALVGTGAVAESAITKLKGIKDIHVIGVFTPDNAVQPMNLTGMPVCGNVSALLELSTEIPIDCIVLAPTGMTSAAMKALIQQISVQPINIKVASESVGLDRVHSTAGDAASFAGLSLVPIADKPISELSFFLKGMVERILAVLILLMIMPVLTVCAVGIKLNSPGPVLFMQRRVGYKGREFYIYKFRTMHVSAVPNTKLTTRNDPRIFSFGSFLRKTSLDELPQLLSVVKGDMALVGPRPHMPEARAAGALYFDAVQDYAWRHRVKPGITGWAQVNGWRGPTDTIEQIQNRVQHDLYYIENWSFWLDFAIVLRTAVGGFISKNAF